MSQDKQTAADYIVPLNMNGLRGRMLRMPAPSNRKREMLLIYGHHGLIERWFGLAQNLNEYGAVTMPDIPGFGGMDSFYHIGQKATIDNYADYLAAFVKLKYKRSRVTVVGISFGFVVITRMLQRYPELAKKVDMVVSMVGFVHKDDFLFSPLSRRLFVGATRVMATPPMPFLTRYVALNKPVISFLYARLPAGRKRFVDMEPLDRSRMMDFDTMLWQANDVRTHWSTTNQFLKLDNCRVRIDLPVWHITAKNDHYFNNDFVREHMLVVFRKYNQVIIDSAAHTPSILADKKGLSVLVPPQLRRALLKTDDE